MPVHLMVLLCIDCFIPTMKHIIPCYPRAQCK